MFGKLAVLLALALVGCTALGARPLTPRHTPKPKPTATATLAPTLTPQPMPSPSGGYVFDDEFNGTSLDPGWNTVKNWYIGSTVQDASMVSVANGYLTIKATQISGAWHGASISSAPSWSQMYGYFEARMRFNSGKGLWPAFWLAPIVSGDYREIDINETLANPYDGTCGNNSGAYFATVHLQDGSTPDGSHRYCAPGDLAGVWHVYAADWRSDHIAFLIDGVEWYRFSGPVSTSLQIVLNLAVGGWAGAPDSTTPDPSFLDVDWVHVSP